MDGTFRATVGFQDSDFFSESNKNGVEMHFECDFSLFRIQTLTQSHPLLWFSLLSVLQFVVQFATCNTSFEVPVGKAYCVVLKKACAVPFMSDLQSFCLCAADKYHIAGCSFSETSQASKESLPVYCCG